MIGEIIKDIKNMEKSIFKVMIKGIKISFIFCIIAVILLSTYIIKHNFVILYEAGLILFRTGLILIVFCFLCSFIVDKLKKEII